MCPAVAYEMLVSHSPPVFSHSPPTGFLYDYNPFHLPAEPFLLNSCRFAPTSAYALKKAHSPKRPILVVRAPDPCAQDDEAPASPTKHKKKVVFADDKGMSLTHVRVMSEPSNVPPLWSFRFLAEVTHGVCAEPEAAAAPAWEIAFAQPASDYVDFRKRLETAKVSLENVIVKEGDDVIVGTVKVSNLAFDKEVFVRASANGWKTFEDAFCKYVAGQQPGGAYVLFDTFAFKVALPPKGVRFEFCVGFRCEGNEYWDSNGGRNYVISKKCKTGPMHKSFSSDDLYKKRNEGGMRISTSLPNCGDAVQTKLDSWSEFASWTHLENSTPYW